MIATDGSQNCGAGSKLSIMKKGAAAPAPTTAAPATTTAAPAPTTTGTAKTWTYQGCFVDGPARALTGSSLVSSSMTLESCTAKCASGGFTMAGLEYSTECYCGNSFVNSLGQQADASKCNMKAAGNTSQKAGGNYVMDVYKVSTTTKREKHFGRHNFHHAQF